jgi:Family of unknown function (DUF6521)
MSITWMSRPTVLRNLFNPAFLGVLLSRATEEYAGSGMAPVLAYVALPLILHRETRKALPYNTRTSLTAWTQDHPELLIAFPEHVRKMRPFTEEAIIFACSTKLLRFDELTGKLRRGYEAPATDPEDVLADASDCLSKAKLVGRWLAKSGSTATIFALLGIRP